MEDNNILLEELKAYGMTDLEKTKVEELNKLIAEKVEIMDIEISDLDSISDNLYNEQVIGYKEGLGYFIITGDHLEHSQDIEEAALVVLHKFALNAAFLKEESNRYNLEKEWRYSMNVLDSELTPENENPQGWIYNYRYDARKYRFEYLLQMLQKTIDVDKLVTYIKMYTDILNFKHQEEVWVYDGGKMEFVEIVKK